jgi:hypothetical protein
MSNDHRNLTRSIVHILHEFSTVDFWESNTFYSIILLTYLCFRQTLYMPLRQWIHAEDVGDLTIGWKWQEHDLTIGSKCVMNQKIWRRVWYIFYMIFQRFFFAVDRTFPVNSTSLIPRIKTYLPYDLHLLLYNEYIYALVLGQKRQVSDLSIGSKCVMN